MEMEQREYEVSLVMAASGLDYNRAKSLVEKYLPKVGEPLWKQRLAANETAIQAAADAKNAEIFYFKGNEEGAMEFQALSSAFSKISDLAKAEVDYMSWKETQGM